MGKEKEMTGREIRETFLKYFEGKGHKRLPSSSLIPHDPTVLLTLAGMLQFKPIFLGAEKPKFPRVTTVQKCVRTNDIGEVGKTARHHTFFEMLGNFSFGDYFKKDAIAFAWELITEKYNLSKNKLWVAVFREDNEAHDLWRNFTDVSGDHIIRLDEDNNFWAAGPTGPCGPCSEIYWDNGANNGCGRPTCAPGCECDRFLEIWNLVFMEFERSADGTLKTLPKKNIDTGMGLERITSVVQGVVNNFDTDLFLPITNLIVNKIPQNASLNNIQGVHSYLRSYKEREFGEKTLAEVFEAARLRSIRIIADHSRAITHMLADGIAPSNEGRGYIARKLIRNVQTQKASLNIEANLLMEIAKLYIQINKDIYPELFNNMSYIFAALEGESMLFRNLIENNLPKLNAAMDKANAESRPLFPEEVFKLYDTYGIPFDVTQTAADIAGIKVEFQGVEALLEKQRKRARAAGGEKDIAKVFWRSLDLSGVQATKFVGYEKTETEATVLKIFDNRYVVTDQTPFYVESGGQVSDQGVIRTLVKPISELPVLDMVKGPDGILFHVVESAQDLAPGMKIKLIVNEKARRATEKNHTATHMLHAALRKVLGENTKQAGSLVAPELLRFDFTAPKALDKETLKKIEDLINEKIKADIALNKVEMPYDEAVKSGAIAFFGEKYGDKVRVIDIPGYSKELCGGTHVSRSGDIGIFKIANEGSVAAGVRRIVAYTADGVGEYLRNRLHQHRQEMGRLLDKIPPDLDEAWNKAVDLLILAKDPARIDQWLALLDQEQKEVRDKKKAADKNLEREKLKQAASDLDVAIQSPEMAGPVPVVAALFDDMAPESLRQLVDQARTKLKSGVVLIISRGEGRLQILVGATPDLVTKGIHAGKIVAEMAQVVDGKGGGRPDLAQGGGKDISKANDAIQRGLDVVARQSSGQK